MHLVMIGGSDAGISAALRARELDPAAEVTVVVPLPAQVRQLALTMLQQVTGPTGTHLLS